MNFEYPEYVCYLPYGEWRVILDDITVANILCIEDQIKAERMGL